jgi:hypothetical protein
MEIALILLVLAAAVGVGAVLVTLRRRRAPADLRGDWWSAFERDFRAYAAQAAGRDRQRRRHRGERA